MTPSRPLHPGERQPFPLRRPSPGEPSNQIVRPSFRPVPAPVRRFQKRPMTTELRPDRLPDPMTICIAATSVKHKAIVTVSDMMLSDDFSSVDVGTVKSYQLPSFGNALWHCMYSGTPSTWEDLIRFIFEYARTKPDAPATLQGMLDALECAYSTVIAHRIQAEVLAPFGISRDEFFATGLERFGERYFRELSEECRKIRLDVDLIVAGFINGKARVPLMFAAQKETSTCINLNTMNFHAIGAGAWAAFASLYTHKYWATASVSQIVYRLCEAKFLSEMARSVGSVTMVRVLFDDDSKSTFTVTNDNDVIRQEWLRYRGRALPENVLNSIDERISLDRGKAEATPPVLASSDPQQIEDPEPSKPS